MKRVKYLLYGYDLATETNTLWSQTVLSKKDADYIIKSHLKLSGIILNKVPVGN